MLFTSCSLSAIKVVSSVYLRLLIFLLEIWFQLGIHSAWPFAYKLSEQDDNIQPWWNLFPIFHQSTVPCPVLTLASWPGYKFLRMQVRCFGIPISLRILHSLLGSTQWKTLVSQRSSQWSRNSFSRIPLLFRWSSGCWQLDLWFLCLF